MQHRYRLPADSTLRQVREAWLQYTVWDVFHRICGEAGIHGASPHDFRHGWIFTGLMLEDDDGKGPTSALAARVDGQVVLLVDGLRLRVNGPELTVSLRRALERHISQPAIAGAC